MLYQLTVIIINILLDGENISFDASLVMYINGTSIPPIIISNRMYENQNLLYTVPLIRHTIVVCILRRNERDVIKTVCWSSCKVPFVHVRF